ncbi:MAG: type II toxin-antitoxin system PemK/MazF family toxin [Desulfobulbaceae bacterium]|nr:type II toxin-antitoxin system PemK/MazF family toxin [Desulfobulbaceae bacterium]
MTTSKFGDIILVPFPFTNQTTTKKRPVVVVSSEQCNNCREDIIIMRPSPAAYIRQINLANNW